MRLANQTQTILAHLNEGKMITPMEALNRYGCFRLASRIHDLRAQGHDIERTFDGDGDKKWAVYKLKKQGGSVAQPNHPASH